MITIRGKTEGEGDHEDLKRMKKEILCQEDTEKETSNRENICR
jgi:hypothetical protein